jgi:hypothetical protein
MEPLSDCAAAIESWGTLKSIPASIAVNSAVLDRPIVLDMFTFLLMVTLHGCSKVRGARSASNPQGMPHASV